MKITDFGVAIVETDTHLSRWCVEQRRLDVQAEFCRLFTQYIPHGGVVADVGACIGDHTLSYSEMVGPTGRVYAFEPNPVAFECLNYNMQHRSNVDYRMIALGAKPSRAIIANPSELNMGATMVQPITGNNGPIKVETLDSIAALMPRLDFLKIDAEGMEPDIILGAIETIKRLRPVILVEINRTILYSVRKLVGDVIFPLEKLGYTTQPAEPHHTWAMETLDVLCLPQKT